jgi:Ca2+-binding RTX toxin-like protein
MRRKSALAALAASLIVPGAVALANTSHAGWPSPLVRQQNKANTDKTTTGVPGVHNELLGGHGSDTINGANNGDVIWGDYNPSGQPTTQVDHLNGGTGMDFIYASHGINYISTGGGGDMVHAHYGSGQIRCGSAKDIVFISHKSKPHYKLIGCKHISFATVGF